jgi:hypothetical protein
MLWGVFYQRKQKHSPAVYVQVSTLHKRYIEWADKNGENRMSSRALGEALSERGIKKSKNPKDGNLPE